jgi:prevent-host-death family protein
VSRSVNIHEAKTHLSRLLELVRAGETVIIAKAGHPVAELRPIAPRRVVLGGLAGLVEYDDAEFAAADDEVRALFDEDTDA